MSESRTSSNTKHSLLPSSPLIPHCHKTRRLQNERLSIVTKRDGYSSRALSRRGGEGALWAHYVFACAVGILGPLLASLDLGGHMCCARS